MTRRNTGFTLIEVLVALAVSALLSLVLMHGIRLAAAGLGRHTRVVERLDARESLDDLLRRALGAAAAIPRISGGIFDGTANSLEFLAVAEDGSPGVYRIGLALDRGRLILHRALAAPTGDPRAASSVLASNLRAFRLSYFGADAADATPIWHDTWRQLAALPLLVRVILGVDGDPPRPPLVVRLWNGG